MGMRGTIAFVSKDKSVKLTSVQWSTRLDQTLGHMVSESIKKNIDPESVLTNLFRTITESWDHISAVEINDNSVSERDAVFNDDVFIAYPQKNFEQETYTNRSAVDIYDYHLDCGSIGAIYDESKPDIIEFFWVDDDTDTVKSRKSNIYSLAKFYNNVFENPGKLKKFSFRNR